MQRARTALNEYRSNPKTVGALWEAVSRDIVDNVGSTRASVWQMNVLQDAITCLTLFDKRTDSVLSGIVLKEDDFPPYFDAIKRDMKVIADDAATHPATSCFDEVYFVPNDIRSLLDFVIMDGSTPIAVLCCENCGSVRSWTDADIGYLQSMAALVRIAFKAARSG